jgi:hypothetical protein
MAKRYTKKHKSKKQLRKSTRKTRKIKYGGDSNAEIVDMQSRKNRFRNNFKDLIIQITNKKNANQAINSIISNFKNNATMINTLIPVSKEGKPLDVKTYSSRNPVVDFVSPVMVIFDNLTGIVNDGDLIRLLNAYFKNGGNFNNLSSRFKITPIQNEINKRRVANVKMLLDQSNPFHIIEDGFNDETRRKLAELIPADQKINTNLAKETETILPTAMPTQEPEPNLILPYPLPENNEIGYDRNVAPEFWKPIFENGEELISLRNTFLELYQQDRFIHDNSKRLQICDLLETLFPGYYTKYYTNVNEKAKTLVNMNISSCVIALLYGMITYKLYEYKQEYLILFKGGRAIQLSLNDIPNVRQYFSEDADILIIPNKTIGAHYDFGKMENLSGHIAYLVKWFIPEDINVVVSLPSNPKNQSNDLTKLVYNDDRLFKALSDIGFGEMKEDIQRYFENPSYSPFYLDQFETTALFITPTIDDMLSEKLYFYTKYSSLKNKLKNHQPIVEKEYEHITEHDCDFYIYKFNKAIKQLVDSILKRDYISQDNTTPSKLVFPETISDFRSYKREEKEQIYKNIDDTSRTLIRGIITHFDDYTIEEKERAINELFP